VLGDIWKIVIKIMYFRHISAKIIPKTFKIVHYQFKVVRTTIRLEDPQASCPLGYFLSSVQCSPFIETQFVLNGAAEG